MPTWNIPALLFAVALSLGMAITGGLLTGNQLTRWFATLHKPRFQLPLWGFLCVGLYGYIVDSIIAYRLLTVVPEQTARIIALTALIVVMLYNELWNIVLFRWHNTFAGFLGVLIFLLPLAFLQVTLVLVDSVSAWLVFVYVLWAIGYDIPWAYRLWRLNPPLVYPAN
ncbi:MAG TPA: TspO/MBR family protein [Ktedonobacteraceae bacterium]|jgi:benzodiazapine receptor|nr:TspO/MBR family protein [Ktedonobacteraceae bacterium]